MQLAGAEQWDSVRTLWDSPCTVRLPRPRRACPAGYRPCTYVSVSCALCIQNLPARVTCKCPSDLNQSPASVPKPPYLCAANSAADGQSRRWGWSLAHCGGRTPGNSDVHRGSRGFHRCHGVTWRNSQSMAVPGAGGVRTELWTRPHLATPGLFYIWFSSARG